MYEAPKQNDALGTTNRGNPCESGLCTLCSADCKGKCETWLSALLGRKLLYPRDFGETTAGSAKSSQKGSGTTPCVSRGTPMVPRALSTDSRPRVTIASFPTSISPHASVGRSRRPAACPS